MADEEKDILELEDLDDADSSAKVDKERERNEKRYRDLSEKVRQAEEARRSSEEKLSTLEKERNFLDSFGGIVAKYPNAVAYKDTIKEKALKGYSVEDATISTLIANNQLELPKSKETPPENPVGGAAAPNQIGGGGKKSLHEMTRDEKRAELLEAEKRGDITLT